MINLSNSGLPLDMNVNVNIRVYNGRREVIQQINKHNKATHNMTEGVVKFLRGEFNETSLNVDTIGHDSENARYYIPTHIGFGNVGTTSTNSTNDLSGESSTFPVYTDKDYPQYSDDALRSEIFKSNKVNGEQENHRAQITRNTSGDSVLADTRSLTLSTTINYSSDFSFYTNSSKKPIPYYNVEEYGEGNKIIITEVGLFSGDVDNSKSKLLARMLLDENTPLIIDKESTVVISWIIGVYSVDDMLLDKPYNDYSYTEKETNVQDLIWEEE